MSCSRKIFSARKVDYCLIISELGRFPEKPYLASSISPVSNGLFIPYSRGSYSAMEKK